MVLLHGQAVCSLWKEEVLMGAGGGTKDGTNKPARPPAHGNHPNDKIYEHPDITDNRLTWEVLEEGENK